MDRSAAYDFLLTVYSKHGPISYRYTAISVENREFFPPRVFCARAEGVPFGIWYRRRGSKTRMMELPDRTKSLTTSSGV